MSIALGTAQFGMHYGVSNQLGQTKEYEVEKILTYAYKQGINTLDTAPSYGNSEDVIGNYVCNHSTDEHWDVITKIPHFKTSTIDDKHIDKLFKTFFSLQKKLGKKSIYGLLIHNYSNLLSPGGKMLLDAMESLKKDGFVKKIGVSLYNGQQIDYLLDNYSIDLVQLPINILDQRLIEGGQLAKLKKNSVEIHARSAFLQGLLLMPIKNVPSWFGPILGVLESFHMKAREQNISALQLALSFVHSINEVDRVVVGVNTLNQLHEIINAKSLFINTEEFSSLSICNPDYLNPSNWGI
jgi:aryl-alcohol dehydrogenase-like predicted oxidoreductase